MKPAGTAVRILMTLMLAAAFVPAACAGGGDYGIKKVRVDSIAPAEDAATRYTGLTEADFRLVAEELGVEVAAIKAVVEIEAGRQMKGFWAPGVPVINFDRSMFSRFRRQGGAGVKGEKVPSGLSGYALREWTQYVNARRVSGGGASMGTFWGMFQIGGFNYRICGCESIDEFVRLMSYSELEQLELFANFITNAGMLPDLKARNWAGFSRKYNGPGYARRGYHTRMAAAYKKYKSQAAHEAAVSVPAESGQEEKTPRKKNNSGNNENHGS